MVAARTGRLASASTANVQTALATRNEVSHHHHQHDITSTKEHIFSSEGALYVIVPYDYPAAQRTHFLNTHRSLITTLCINAMMTLLTVISMMTKMTKIT